jgi:hypothetical protein
VVHGANKYALKLTSSRDFISGIRKLVHQHENLLQEIVNNTRALRRLHNVEAPESILHRDETNESVVSQLLNASDARQQSEEASFESSILNSKVCAKAFVGVVSPAYEEQSNDAITKVENGPSPRLLITNVGSKLARHATEI